MTMALPSFLICGAEKSGTTALFYFVKEHPEVYGPAEKELHFFTRNYEKGVKWYESRFRVKESTKVIGEASPSYMYDPAVPERIKSLIPDAKLIFILRHPVDRAYSHYWQIRRNGKETLSFDEAIKRAMLGERSGDSKEGMQIEYLRHGRYAEHLKRFFAVFPEKNILVLIHRNLKNEPEKLMRDVFEFIGVDEDFKSDKWREKPNRGVTPKSKIADRIVRMLVFRNRLGLKLKFFMNRHKHMDSALKFMGRMLYREGYPPMSPETRKILLDYYEPLNRELEKMLGRSLDWWYE